MQIQLYFKVIGVFKVAKDIYLFSIAEREYISRSLIHAKAFARFPVIVFRRFGMPIVLFGRNHPLNGCYFV